MRCVWVNELFPIVFDRTRYLRWHLYLYSFFTSDDEPNNGSKDGKNCSLPWVLSRERSAFFAAVLQSGCFVELWDLGGRPKMVSFKMQLFLESLRSRHDPNRFPVNYFSGGPRRDDPPSIVFFFNHAHETIVSAWKRTRSRLEQAARFANKSGQIKIKTLSKNCLQFHPT